MNQQNRLETTVQQRIDIDVVRKSYEEACRKQDVEAQLALMDILGHGSSHGGVDPDCLTDFQRSKLLM